MTTATTALTEFLLARIAEDVERWTTGRLVTEPHSAPAFGPLAPRMLAECAALRRIVERLEPITEADDGCVCDRCMTLRDLAAVYADHPDYRDEWKPWRSTRANQRRKR